MNRIIVAVAALVALSAGASRAAEPPKDPKVYTIGALLAMTGQASFYGQTMSQGMKQAIDEINAKGGVDGIPLEAAIEDHKGGGGQDGVSAMNRLISIHHVQAVLTSFSAPTIAVAPIAEQQHIFMLNGGGVSPQLVGLSKYLFHNRSLSTDLSRVALTYANELGGKKLAEIQWQNDVGDNIVKIVGPMWKGFGGTIVATEAVAQGATNMDTQVAKVRAANPDVIALWTFNPETGLALKRIRDFGMKQPIIGVDFTENDAKIAGPAAEGFHFALDYFAPSDSEPWSKQFAADYKKRYGTDPDFYAANYYEGVYVIAECIKRARAKGGDYWTGDGLRDALLANPKFDSVYGGQMVFQSNGVALKRTALFTIEDGKRKFVKFLEVKQ
ncbi:MAG TPA: ABC transporter substrate-binding protein [Stellaceae bacterium]|nr:ABC transporter substrate-binding protein [Stellaceae bacterium]